MKPDSGLSGCDQGNGPSVNFYSPNMAACLKLPQGMSRPVVFNIICLRTHTVTSLQLPAPIVYAVYNPRLE
jgi:hypothetical protein